MSDDAKRELPRITVPVEIDEGIRRLSQEGGQTIVWHRRKAYEEYVQRHAPVEQVVR